MTRNGFPPGELMTNKDLSQRFSDLSTALLCDASLRIGTRLLVADPRLRPISPHWRLCGRVFPVRHYGSVDIFLEAMGQARLGDVLVIDNQGSMGEGCVGDLTALEAKAAGLAGMVVWGSHRDTRELLEIDFPVFSLGRCPMGPRRLDEREPSALASARVGEFAVDREQLAFADADGVVFAPARDGLPLLEMARKIRNAERRQAAEVKSGRTLRDQLKFDTYLQRKAADPSYTFRKHLREIGGAIEE